MDKYILITGACSEIGKAVCHNLAKTHNLILHGRDISQLESLQQSLERVNYHLIFRYNFSDINGLEQSILTFLKENNVVIQALVHIAGVFDAMPVRCAEHNSLMHSFNVNFFSAVDIIHCLLNHYRKDLENVVVVSTVSLHTLFGRGNIAYLSSKAALEAFVKVAASELSPNIRVNAVAPGRLQTESLSLLPNETVDKLVQQHPLGLGRPEDISNIITYLIEDTGSWITGQVFIIDGGNSCRKI